MEIDFGSVGELMRQAADQFILPRFHRLADGDIDTKSNERDLVTIADLECEAWLGPRLRDLAANSIIVGEEAVYADPGLLDRIGGEVPVWIIDPVDGTHNFVHDNPRFAVIVALVVGPETVGAWIFEPALERFAVAEKGAGVTLDGVRVEACGTGEARYTGNALRHFYDRASARPDMFARVIRTSCAGHEYLRILDGRADFSAYTRSLPWDHAAGALMIREAGGVSASPDGAPYDPAHPRDDLISARDAASWRIIRDALCAT